MFEAHSIGSVRGFITESNSSSVDHHIYMALFWLSGGPKIGSFKEEYVCVYIDNL